MKEIPVEIDTGTAYEMSEPIWDTELVDVEKGTPTGEMLRRYWHPFALTSDATDTPRGVTILGEQHDAIGANDLDLVADPVAASPDLAEGSPTRP